MPNTDLAIANNRQDDPRTVLHWYDFLCPFCYLGQHRTAILVRHGLRIVELPFQAHPDIPPGEFQRGLAMGRCTPCWSERPEQLRCRCTGLGAFLIRGRPWLLPSGPDGISHALSPSYTKTFLTRILSLARTLRIPL